VSVGRKKFEEIDFNFCRRAEETGFHDQPSIQIPPRTQEGGQHTGWKKHTQNRGRRKAGFLASRRSRDRG
jgi:hypothetical protein